MNDTTLRDYLAAHAPVVPQEWFKPRMAPPPEYNTNWKICPECQEGFYRDCREPATCDGKELKAYRDKRDVWKEDRKKATLTQWPWAWADAILAVR